jgi:hypothetical protein
MTSSDGPRVNEGRFRIGPRHAVTAILPASQLDWCVSELNEAGFPSASIEILRGEEGREILDIKGTHHGVRGWLIRTIQVSGSIHNEMLNYDSALRNGLVVVGVRVANEQQMAKAAHILFAHEGERVVAYAGKGSETQWL